MFAAIVGQSWADDAHPYNIECNGIDVVAKVPMESVRIEMAGPGTNGSMSFTIMDADASVTVAEWDEVRFVEHAATRPILFGGFVQSVRYRAWAAVGRDIEVECVGYGILLDRKVVPAQTLSAAFDPDGSNGYVGPAAVSIVNRYGGRVTAASWSFASSSATDETRGVTGSLLNWYTSYANTGTQATSTQTLRNVLDMLIAESNFTDMAADPQPVGGAFWVDSAAMLRLFPEPGPDSNLTTYGYLRYDGTSPGLQVDAAGTYRVIGLTYEREDSDRLSSSYVEGGSAPGTGYYRAPALERAGDLEGYVNDSSSAAAADIVRLGTNQVGQTSGATVRGEVSISAGATLAVWPGREIDLTNAQLGLTSASTFRMTAVSVAFLSKTSRVYTIAFGGTAAAPSMSNRQGRYATR